MVAPILKWAGGKRWLVSGGKLPKPKNFDRYVEPFAGSAAVFFFLEPTKALLSDMNAELINFYEVIRSQPAELQAAMGYHQQVHSSSHYYHVRSAVPETKLGRAARFLYLNRTCWNGLYRVNRLGEFNVPIGTKQAVVMDSDDFQRVSGLLRDVELRCSDFESVIDECGTGDFLFVDPPYTAKHNFNGFLKYNETIFSWDDQVRLHSALSRAASRGAAICVTNANHASLQSLYADFDLTVLSRQSVLAGRSLARGKTTEALFTANLE